MIRSLYVSVFALTLFACSDSKNDSQADTSSDVTVSDGNVDGASDVIKDAPIDGATDTLADAPSDFRADVPGDAPADVGTDVVTDGGVDLGTDTLVADGGVDVGPDTLVADTGVDLGTDSVVADSGVDVGPDTLVAADTGVDLGTDSAVADSGVDVGSDTLVVADTGVDLGTDSVVADGGVDVGSDTLVAADTGVDLGTDSLVADTSDTGSITYGIAGQSCKNLTTLCQNESCCTSIVVPGGTFTQGWAAAGAADQAHSSTVSSYALDKYEVTVGRFRQFVNAYVSNTASAPATGAGANPNIAGTGWDSAWNANLPATQAAFISALNCGASDQTWTDDASGGNEAKAINCVDWYEAQAFCAWDGGRLPTESEWEYAAAGGSEDRVYPWGSKTLNCTYANYSGCTPFAVWNVGSLSKGAGKWGHQDLTGNVREWNFDWYGNYGGYPSNNYANIAAGSGRVLRGGDFFSIDAFLSVATRISYPPAVHESGVGLRCSRTP